MNTELNTLKTLLREALQTDGGLSVFKYYGFEPSRRPQRENPFRQERSSSFFVSERKGSYFFKDFGDDTFKGNAWKFVQLYENLQDNAQVFQILCNIYGLGYVGTLQRALPTKKLASPTTPTDTGSMFEKRLHKIEFQDFSEEELAFWYKKGFITQDTLKANGVLSVKSFSIEVSAGKFANYDHLQFVFAYQIVAGKAYKLYMPKPEHRVYAKSKTIFLPNLQPAKELLGAHYAYHFGLDTLRQEPFILCGGEPDCLALKDLGFNAFTLGDERASIPPYIWAYLQTKWGIANPETYLQAILYDTDYTGIMHSRKLGKALQVPAIILPKLHQQTKPEQPKPIQNDLCDYLGLYGFDAALEVALHKRHVRTRDFALPAVPCFTVERYLSEKTAVLTEFIRSNNKIQLDADTGVGKTFTILADLPARLEKTVLFAVPFAIQVEQIENEYATLVQDLVCFTNKETQALSEEDKTILMNRPTGKVNVCTIDRIKPVFERLELEHGKDIVVVIDESHLLTSEYGYRMQAIHDVLEVCRKVEKVVYLSATPDYSLCRFSGFKLIQFRRNQNPSLEVQAVDYEGSPKQNLLQLLLPNNAQPEDQQKEGVTVVRLNNKTLAKVIANLLIAEGTYKAHEIDFVFSEKRKGLSTPSRESIVQHSLIPAEVRLLFVTACFDCGLNIKNTHIAKIISFETQYTDNCLDTLKQLVARFRCMENLSVMVCKSKKYQELPAIKSKAVLYERLQQDAQAKLRLLPYIDEAQQATWKQPFSKLPAYIKHNPDISAIHKLIYWHKKNQTYQINYNYIRFALKEYERKNMNSPAFYAYLQNELPCLTLVNRETVKATLTEENKKMLSELLAIEKSQKETRQLLVVRAMQQNPQAFFDAVFAAYRDQSLKEKIKKHFAISLPKDAPKIELLLQEALPDQETNTPAKILDINNFDEDLTTFSHRYFYLLDLQIPSIKIPSILQQHASGVQFMNLTRNLSNHINLLAYQEAGKDWHCLTADARKDVDIKWLANFAEQVSKWNTPQFTQKKTATLNTKLKDAQERLQTLRTAHEDTLLALTERQETADRRSTVRDMQRKIDAAQNRLTRQTGVIAKLETDIEQATVIGWEIQALSGRINRTRLHSADWQNAQVNMRLLQSLFEVSTQKRAVLLPSPTNAKESIYVEKTFIKIGERLAFQQVLQNIGFEMHEAENYLHDLRYQIHLDIQHNLAKIHQKSLNTSIETISAGTLGDGTRTLAMPPAVLLNENGYPLVWD